MYYLKGFTDRINKGQVYKGYLLVRLYYEKIVLRRSEQLHLFFALDVSFSMRLLFISENSKEM